MRYERNARWVPQVALSRAGLRRAQRSTAEVTTEFPEERTAREVQFEDFPRSKGKEEKVVIMDCIPGAHGEAGRRLEASAHDGVHHTCFLRDRVGGLVVEVSTHVNSDCCTMVCCGVRDVRLCSLRRVSTNGG